jgi:signal transduction histidine kinase/DNA-binding LacI/PurR family transcriptional regulator/CheY-like chemotaxis protein
MRSHRPTVGFICTWPVYQGTRIDRHAHALMQGVRAAARDRRCNLLVGAGFSPVAERAQWRTAWPVPAPETDFVPVGPWNTDGLIIVPDDLSASQAAYVRDIEALGVPVVFTMVEAKGQLVLVDNTIGIREAVGHLMDHGHRRIAFVAGKDYRGGDSAERLGAYREAMREAGFAVDPRLIAYGDHRVAGGRLAMGEILRSGAEFTAFVASNDLSCLGAIDALRDAGRRVPEDVAAIGFDDILDARAHTPTLTTVRHPTFALGYQAVVTLLDGIAGKPKCSPVVVPTRLIVRQSCGCRRDQREPGSFVPVNGEPLLAALSRAMAEAAFGEARHSTPQELEEQCQGVLLAVAASIVGGTDQPLSREIAQLLKRTDERGEDAHVWQSAISALIRSSSLLRDVAAGADPASVMALLDRARLDISEHVQRQTTHALLEHMDMLSELGQLTSQLLAALDISEAARILAERLPRLDIDHFVVALFAPDAEDDPHSSVEVVVSEGQAHGAVGRHFRSRDFPPQGMYRSGEPIELLVLPLRVGDRQAGFVALSATNLEAAAAIVTNLATAIRASTLYREAVEGRRLAEDANQLKSRFLSMVSHELRTPLSIVVGLSEMVLRESHEGTGLPEHTVRDLERMLASAEHLGVLIGDVLDLASSEAGQLRLVCQPVDLAEVLTATIDSGRQMAHAKGLEWRARMPVSGPWVSADRTRLRQVLLNLVSNAVKFTEEGAVTLEVSGTDDLATISVSDTGPGVAEAELEAIFEDFHRSERARTRGPGGLGLGLPIARLLVQLHGGSISVRSPGPSGRGSTFSVTLPAIVPALPSSLLPEQGSTVVLVTSGHAAETGLARQLEERGFAVRVLAVGSRTDWADDVVDIRPGAVILDAGVAAERGWELVRKLQRRPELGDVAVLACRLAPGANNGAVLDLDFALKPLRPSQLRHELLRRGLGGTAFPAGGGSGAGRGAQPVILVVDDDPDVRDLHARAVERAGGRAIRAATGLEALSVMESVRPDLVLLDLGMPGMDGFELLDAMRVRSATQDIPVIVVTGQMLDDADLDRLDRGVATILSKGLLTPAETLDRIEAVLGRRRALGSATQRLVRRAIAYIELHHSETITRDEIAGYVAISPDYLTDCFHQELGVTPITYLTRCRIRKARELLERSDRSVTDIAMSVGFSEVSHFTRTFHRDVGVSPRAYRRGHRAMGPDEVSASAAVRAPDPPESRPESINKPPIPATRPGHQSHPTIGQGIPREGDTTGDRSQSTGDPPHRR